MVAIKRTSVTTQIIDYMKDCIKSGSWIVGEKIPSETVLSQKLGVSRASLRLAIAQFVTLGLLKPEQGRGCFLISDKIDERMGNVNALREHDYADISKVLKFRLLIEPEATRLACEADTDGSLLEKLRAYHSIMKKSIENPEVFIKADLDFHRTIGFASGNELFGDTLNFIFENTQKSHQQINSLFGFKDGLSFHAKIIKAMEEKDAKKASHVMERHLKHAIEELSDH
jgi:GntR family transcriptional repressor for pyruvate dehydrogenase complex